MKRLTQDGTDGLLMGMTHTFAPAGSTSTIVFPSFAGALDYISDRFPGAIVHGTSVNDGRTEFGKLNVERI